MKFLITFFLVCLTAVIFAQASPEKIDSAAQAYDLFVDEAEEENAPEILSKITTTCTLVKRAIGPVTHDITIYFDRHDELIEPVDDASSSSGPTELHKATIRKVSFTLSSGSYTIHFYYHFNTDGMLIRYQEKVIDSYYGCTLKTFYVNTGACFKIVEESFISEDCPEDQKPFKTEKTQLDNADHDTVKAIVSETNTFRSLLEITYTLLMK